MDSVNMAGDVEPAPKGLPGTPGGPLASTTYPWLAISIKRLTNAVPWFAQAPMAVVLAQDGSMNPN
jgi:hypothetical protein